MIFFNEVLFTSYCCVRYFHERKDILFYIFLGFLLCHFSMQKVSAWSKLVEKHPINHFPTSRILHPPPPLLYFTQIYTPSLCFLEPPPHPIYLRSQYNYEQASYEACFSWIIFISLVLALVSYSFFLCYIGNLPFKYVLTKQQLIMERKILLEGFLSYQKGISLIDAFIIL